MGECVCVQRRVCVSLCMYVCVCVCMCLCVCFDEREREGDFFTFPLLSLFFHSLSLPLPLPPPLPLPLRPQQPQLTLRTSPPHLSSHMTSSFRRPLSSPLLVSLFSRFTHTLAFPLPSPPLRRRLSDGSAPLCPAPTASASVPPWPRSLPQRTSAAAPTLAHWPLAALSHHPPPAAGDKEQGPAHPPEEDDSDAAL